VPPSTVLPMMFDVRRHRPMEIVVGDQVGVAVESDLSADAPKRPHDELRFSWQ